MEISEYKQLFLSEAQEILSSLNKVLVELEKDPANSDFINELFRQSHTLKSMAQSMGYGQIAELTHSMESTLALLRSGELKAEKETVDLLFKSLDALSNLTEDVRKGKAEGVKVSSLVKRFEDITSAVPKEERKPQEEKRLNLRLDDVDRRRIVEERNKGIITYRVTISLNPGAKKKEEKVPAIVKKLQSLGEVIKPPFLYKQLERGRLGRHFGLFFITKHLPDKVKKKIEAISAVQSMVLKPLDIDEIILPSKERRAEEAATPMPVAEVQSVRVPLTQLDNLMDIVGELAINKTRLIKISQEIEDKPLEDAIAHMSRLTSQLQDQMMQVRLIPLEYIFAPYSRLVRDMAVAQKKDVDLVIQGSNIGMDRAIQDEINEPLLHLLKNAVVHGIETSKEREGLKKAKRGRIKLVASREKNYVAIELSDDGRGIDIEGVKEEALKRGVITKEELSILTPEETAMLITSPGYSGAKNISEIAGRGAGMNAARIKVESLGGVMDINTKPDEGTTFLIKLPLTMAIVQALLVAVADEVYCIPLSYIAKTIQVAPEEIKTMENHEMISYIGTVLPLLSLRKRLGFDQPSAGVTSNQKPVTREKNRIPIVVVETGRKRAGLVVDSFLGQQDVVIKPLTGILKQIKDVSGATILGTGKAALIVDVPSLL